MTTQEKDIRALLSSKQTVVVDNRLMRLLGYDDTRTFFEQLGNWGYNTDFGTISSKCDTDTQAYLREFIRSFLD